MNPLYDGGLYTALPVDNLWILWIISDGSVSQGVIVVNNL